MKKLVALFFVSCLFLTTQSYDTFELHPKCKLTQKAESLEQWKTISKYYWTVAFPCIVVGTLSARDSWSTGFSLTIAALLGKCGVNITTFFKGYSAQSWFRFIFDKKIDEHGIITSDFIIDAPFILNDQQFVAFGIATDIEHNELLSLAQKSGRAALAAQLSATHYYIQKSI